MTQKVFIAKKMHFPIFHSLFTSVIHFFHSTHPSMKRLGGQFSPCSSVVESEFACWPLCAPLHLVTRVGAWVVFELWFQLFSRLELIFYFNIFHDLKGDTRVENLKGGLNITFESEETVNFESFLIVLKKNIFSLFTKRGKNLNFIM